MKVTKAWMCTKKNYDGMTTVARGCGDCYPVVILQRSSYRRLLAVVKAAKKYKQSFRPFRNLKQELDALGKLYEALAKLEGGK